jgi:hypothetical protein
MMYLDGVARKEYDSPIGGTSNMGTHRIRFSKVTALPAKKQTEWKHRDILSPSFLDAAITVEWLNAAKGSPAYRRVLEVRSELEALRAELDKPFQAIVWETAKRPTTQSVEHLRRQRKFIRRHQQLNLLLGKYAFTHVMVYNFTSRDWWVTAIPKNPSGPQIVIEKEVRWLPKIRVSEASVVLALVRLATRHELAKVHLCKQCRECWHVALRSIDQFCSTECREYFHTHSDAYRARKRKIQQDYRDQLRRNHGTR